MARAIFLGRLVLLGTLLLPATARAQEAMVSGTVTDSTGGVLPGVTVTALHEATGNTFVAVTDAAGAFRLPVRAGAFRLTAELAGFGPLTRSIELLVRQNAVVTLQMSPSTVQESVTVTGEAPLIDTVNSSLGSNIDPRQLQELPLNGRNWIDLTMLAAGARQNLSSDTPMGGAGNFQLNIDGQEVTNNMVQSFGQPKFSRDSIAEFEFVANRFDASQGRSMGVQVNAITKSGTNTLNGSFSGYFRDDSFIAKDFIQDRVLPYQNQQFSVTFGGPIKRDRIHFFTNFEYEREPETFSHSSPYPSFNFDQESTRTEKKGGVRLDYQFSPQTRLTFRGNWGRVLLPLDPRYSGGAQRHPSTGIEVARQNDNITVNLSQVIGSRALNEIKAGYSGYSWYQDSIVNWPGHPQAPVLTHGTPIIMLRGYTIGQAHNFSYQNIAYDPYSIRDDFSLSFTKAGRHDLKTGGEYYRTYDPVFHCTWCQGVLDATGGPVPANIESLFPVWDDPGTWNLAALSPITRSYRRGIGDFSVNPIENRFAAWAQDDWAITSRLTLNLGIRYDVISGMYAEDVSVEPFLTPGRPIDTNNIQPRLGFAYSMNDRTVIRGGFGQYFGETGFSQAHWTNLWAGQVHPVILNDGRPNFAADPFNGPAPSFEQAKAMQNSGQVFSSITTSFAAPDAQVPYSYQSSIGVQRQFGRVMAIDADYIFVATRHATYQLDVNLAYNPATGSNYPFADRDAEAVCQRRVGFGGDEPDRGGRQLPGAANVADQADEQQLAGVGDLFAVGAGGLPAGADRARLLAAVHGHGVGRIRVRRADQPAPGARGGMVRLRGAASSPDVQRHLATAVRVPGQRTLYLRRQRASDAGDGTRRPPDRQHDPRPDDARARRRLTDRAQQLRPRLAVASGHACAAALHVRQGCPRRDTGGLQRLQPRELRQLGGERKQRTVRTALGQQQHRVQAAGAATRIPSGVLAGIRCRPRAPGIRAQF